MFSWFCEQQMRRLSFGEMLLDALEDRSKTSNVHVGDDNSKVFRGASFQAVSSAG